METDTIIKLETTTKEGNTSNGDNNKSHKHKVNGRKMGKKNKTRTNSERQGKPHKDRNEGSTNNRQLNGRKHR